MLCYSLFMTLAPVTFNFCGITTVEDEERDVASMVKGCFEIRTTTVYLSSIQKSTPFSSFFLQKKF